MNYTYCPRELILAAQRGDEAAAGALVEKNSGLVWSVARRFYGRGVDPEDLYQLGCLGLVKAIRDFDVAYGTRFSTYAVPKIAGEIRRFLRDDGSIKVSRTVKERAAAIRAAKANLEQRLGRSPTLSELTRATGLDPEEIAAAEIAVEAPDSLQRETGPEGLPLERVIGDWSQEERLVESMALRQAIARLPERERDVISLRYYRGLTQQRTADLLHISQVQVSRLEKRAIGRLRELMTG